MNQIEILRFALRGLLANKMRSALTTLGILIGVAAVIMLVAVGEGSSQSIQQNIQRLGANTLTISPSFSGGGGGGGGAMRGPGGGGGANTGPRTQARQLSLADAKALTDKTLAPSVKSVSPVVNASSSTATYGAASHSVAQFVGTYPSYFEAVNKPVAKGTYFFNDDVLAARKVVVLGQTVVEELFGAVDPIGKQISVSGVPFTVVGVLKEAGSTGMQDADDIAIAPLPAVQQSLSGFGSLGQIVVQATGAGTTTSAQAEVTAILNQRHGITNNNPDYRVLNQATLQETVSEATGTFTVLLGAVAAISLLVGGIGITNIMLVTVTERTREIGIRKAIGAPRSAILGQFLMEATLLSLVGGLSGVLVAFVGTRFTIAGIEPVLVPSSVVLALGVSLGIGLFFGSYPANRAAKLRPIQALRHE
ncbi:Macrolide export ATP-binding/permease protein MacB [[Actinomadura] parvosata subsp. kistnae]|uniref:Macrolide ABC transporter permease n=2 Tax=Nonomuraea TaxID=83681 RepID=A0A1V0A2X2_9ACTN|nr:ABC transporter permease [Nonomuraea sp. ATCC 55076]AQZ64555.1 macrolide ABC transporter permease [Nonomuraea sp. ATCC 55076]SPL99626.1 Macrolide export ATP-binding/permease protein MacB [Actinomadura parvosata subsp. kistnae]